MELHKLVVIIGPTAAKKSHVAVRLASKINGEIINGDAFQVYREINAGVNKPDAETMEHVPHHLINCCSYRDEWNIAIFQKMFQKKYQEITSRHHPVILCGGSHLYTDAILRGYELEADHTKDYIPLFAMMNNINLWTFIQTYDPVSAQKIDLNNRKRLIRVAAIIRANNFRPKSEMDAVGNKPWYDPLVVMVTQDRAQLYTKINNRFDDMWSHGWLEEVRSLVEKDPEIVNTQAFKAIGYQEMANHVLYNQPLDLEKIKQNTRHLAKRQLTWCRNKFPNKIIFDPTTDDFQKLIETVKKYYANPSPLHPHSIL